MIIDKQNLFSNAQAVTAAAASTNYMDLGVATNKLGVGNRLFVVVQCTVAMTDSGSDSTLAVTLEADSATGFATALVTVFTVGTFAALSAIGARLVSPLPAIPTNDYKRYIRLYYTPANGNLTTGSFTAFLAHDVSIYTAFADGFTIS